MTFDVRFSRAAEREFLKLPRDVQERIAPALNRLSQDSHPPGSQRISGGDPVFRVRVGDYRVLYEVNEAQRVVRVIRVGHRREVYRGL